MRADGAMNRRAAAAAPVAIASVRAFRLEFVACLAGS
jgi:hypothetical protein